MILPSHAHIECILNGHRIHEWAGDDPPYVLEFDDSVENHYGHDGAHYPMSSGNIGGELTFLIVPHSLDSKWLIDRERERQKRIVNREKGEQFDGMLHDVVTGIHLFLERGYLIATDRFPVAGQSFEAKFGFERMIPAYKSTRPFLSHRDAPVDPARGDIDRQDLPGTGP